MPEPDLTYQVRVERRADKKLERLLPKIRRQLLGRIQDLKTNPRPQDSIKLKSIEGFRLDNGEYRILYTIDWTNRIVDIYEIRNRNDGYRNI